MTGLIGREASPKFFVRVEWAVMLLDQIKDQLIGLFAHLHPHFTNAARIEGANSAKMGKIRCADLLTRIGPRA